MTFSVFYHASVFYHDIFNYPLTKEELVKWECNTGITGITRIKSVTSKNGYYFLKNREGLIKQRQDREKISVRKLKIAKRASKILLRIPSIKMVAVTGSLAMMNSTKESDIDLMIITKKGTLWTSRLISYLVIWLLGIKTRKSGDKSQKDRLCMNIWLDETDLPWNKSDRNLYTAHEIAQIVPLVNKDKTYEKFLHQNRWILSYWPNSVRIKRYEDRGMNHDSSLLSYLSFILIPLEKISYRLQYNYMKSKLTREIVTPSRALFHPNDWGKVVLKKLSP